MAVIIQDGPQNVNADVVSVYLEPGKPLRAQVAVYDTIVINAVLKDPEGQVVDLTNCNVIVAATDRENTTLYTADIIDAAAGSIQAIVQPSVTGQYKITAKVSVPLAEDEYTFFLGAFSVAKDEEGDPGHLMLSLSEQLSLALSSAWDIANDVQGYYAGAKQYAESALDSKNAAAQSATDASGYANDAQGYASDASGYSTSASGYATNASTYAGNASASATAAHNSELAAASAATTSANAAVAALFTGALAGQVLVKTADGYKWDYPCNAGLTEAAW